MVLKVKLPFDPVLPSVRWSVGLSVIISSQGGNFHFSASIGALVFIRDMRLARLIITISLEVLLYLVCDFTTILDYYTPFTPCCVII